MIDLAIRDSPKDLTIIFARFRKPAVRTDGLKSTALLTTPDTVNLRRDDQYSKAMSKQSINTIALSGREHLSIASDQKITKRSPNILQRRDSHAIKDLSA